jgi:hypothetical protein
VLGMADGIEHVTWWENITGDGTSWTEHTVDDWFSGPYSVHAADIDGDNDMDVLGAAGVASDINWWENTTGDGTSWTEHTVDSSFGGAQAVYAADMDGDDDLDVLGAAYSDEDITWWENTTGDGTTWTEHTIDGSFYTASDVYAEDMDGDEDLDVVGVAWSYGEVTWWENTAGDGTTWIEHFVATAFGGAVSVHAADMDLDGDADVLAAAWAADDIAWWENTTGDGTSFTQHTVDGDFDGARCVYAADIDDDGDLDIVGAAASAGEIAWFENSCIP